MPTDANKLNVDRGTSPSKAHDAASQTSWNAQRPGTTNPQEALNQSYNKNPVNPESMK